MEQTARLLKEILYPAEEFSPIPFWFFNDRPDRDKIRRQLEDFQDKGVNGFVLHPRIGIPRELPYLSEAYFEAVRFVVDTAAELGMKVVLYDEGMYPSGSAHGMVVAENPAFASIGLTLADENRLHELAGCCHADDGREQDGLQNGRQRSAGLQNGIGESGTPHILSALPDGKFLVKCRTGGTIRGIHFGEDDGEAGAPASADILNPEAVAAFIRLTHERYYEELKEYFGDTVIGFFTDEPCALGRNAGGFREWADGMESELQEAGGRLEELEGLFTGEENSTTALYRRIIKKRLRETFYAPLSRWCGDHRIALMGHPAESDDVEEELYFHVPGQDLIMRRVVPLTGGIREPDSVHAKLSADIAKHLGRRRNANECFGVCFRDKIPWYFTGGDMKWYIDWLALRGVNLFVPHAFFYSVEGERKEERPPDVGPHNIWWKHYKRFSDYMKRLSFLMTDSVNGAKAAVLCDNNLAPCEEAAVLYENQVEFNYLPAALLKECRVRDGRLCIREYSYDVILNVLGREYDRLLPQGCRTVHSAEELLGAAVSGTDAGAGMVSAWTDAGAGMVSAWTVCRAVDADRECRSLRAVRLVKYGVEMCLLSNEGAEEIDTRLTLSGGASPLLVDLWNGTFRAAEAEPADGRLRLRLVLQPRETLLLILREAGCEAVCDKPSGSAQEAAAEKPQQALLRERLSRPETFVGDWTERFTLVEKSDNRAVYEYSFEAASVDGTESFAADGEEMAECYCNGALADVGFWSPHRFRIGPFLREGRNEIRLVLTGSAANIFNQAGIYYGLKGSACKEERRRSEGSKYE